MDRGEPPKRKKPLSRSSKPLKRTRLKRTAWTPSARSRERTASRRREWERARDAHMESVGYRCQVCPILAAAGVGPWRMCSGRAVDVHHVLARGMGGSTDHSRLAAACRASHDWVEAHPDKSRELGLRADHG